VNILIKNGQIIDGTGSARYKADVMINEDKIERIGKNLSDHDVKVVDASNKIVAPGFIDMHSHADLTILQVNKAEAYLMQGVTTLVVGMCGLGLAPANDKVRKYYVNLVKSLIGVSKLQLFNTIEDLMNIVKEKRISPNLAFFIPHGNVRTCVLGMENRSPTFKELEEMKEIVRKGMRDGAFGLTTGLIYPPGIITPTDELIELSKIVREFNGIYDSHIRNEGAGILDIGMQEIIEIASKTDVQAQISHWKAGSNTAWDLTGEMIDLVKKAHKKGIRIYADLYPYEESSTTLSGLLLKPWAFTNFEENLLNPDTRRKILDEMIENLSSSYISNLSQEIPKSAVADAIFSYLSKKMRIISVMHNHNIEGFKLGKALETLYPNKDISEALLDFIRDEEGSIMISTKHMSERKSIKYLFQQDFVAIGSDGFLVVKGNTHPRSYGTFPKILGKYVREKNYISLEDAIRKMTSLPVSILHLKDRGIIKIGHKADIVIFDPETVIDKSTYKNGCQYPEGIDYVLVNGAITVKEGKHTGTLNGEILKHVA
jgi:N-acyl-D-aspartate/D-glutamate deacylase